LTRAGLLTSLFASVVFAGCVHVGGKWGLRVVGRLPTSGSTSADACRVQLVSSHAREELRARVVSEVFDEYFFLAPVRDEYYVLVDCGPSRGRYKSGLFVMDQNRQRSQAPFDLGEVELR